MNFPRGDVINKIEELVKSKKEDLSSHNAKGPAAFRNKGTGENKVAFHPEPIRLPSFPIPLQQPVLSRCPEDPTPDRPSCLKLCLSAWFLMWREEKWRE